MKNILRTPDGLHYFEDEKHILSEAKRQYAGIEFTEDDVVIDMGANIGVFDFYIQDKVKSIIAVEAGKEAFDVLKMNLPTSILINKAVVEDNGPKEMIFYLSHNTTLSRYLPNKKNSKTIVETIEIGELMKYKPTILKIDIEWSEYKWIMDFVFPKTVHSIAVELHCSKKDSFEKHDIALKNILSQGFEIITKTPQKMYGRIGAITYVFKRI